MEFDLFVLQTLGYSCRCDAPISLLRPRHTPMYSIRLSTVADHIFQCDPSRSWARMQCFCNPKTIGAFAMRICYFENKPISSLMSGLNGVFSRSSQKDSTFAKSETRVSREEGRICSTYHPGVGNLRSASPPMHKFSYIRNSDRLRIRGQCSWPCSIVLHQESSTHPGRVLWMKYRATTYR